MKDVGESHEEVTMGLSFEGTELREQDKALGVNTRCRDLYWEQSFLRSKGKKDRV